MYARVRAACGRIAVAGLLRRFGFGTVVRLGAAATLLAVAVSVYGPRVVEERTREAVINARLEPVRAPVPGVLRQDLGAPGRAVAPGDLLAVVEDPRVERARESQFAVDLADARGQLAAVEAELARLVALDAGLEARRLRAMKARLLDAALARRQVEARLAAARTVLAERRAHLERVRRLRTVRAVPQDELDLAERTLAEAQAQVEELELERERVLLSLRTLARGTLPSDAQDVPYSRTRMDEFALRAGELARERDRLRARITALERALDRERARREAEQRVALRASFPAVVWRRDVSAGAEVPRDQVLGLLLDCRSLYVTAIVHQRVLPALEPGGPAAARPFGESRWLPGRLVAVRAAPLVGEDGFAVMLRPLEGDEAVVLVELDAPQLARDPARFCHVGRTVELSLARGLPLVSHLYRTIAGLFGETARTDAARAGEAGEGTDSGTSADDPPAAIRPAAPSRMPRKRRTGARLRTGPRGGGAGSAPPVTTAAKGGPADGIGFPAGGARSGRRAGAAGRNRAQGGVSAYGAGRRSPAGRPAGEAAP